MGAVVRIVTVNAVATMLFDAVRPISHPRHGHRSGFEYLSLDKQSIVNVKQELALTAWKPHECTLRRVMCLKSLSARTCVLHDRRNCRNV